MNEWKILLRRRGNKEDWGELMNIKMIWNLTWQRNLEPNKPKHTIKYKNSPEWIFLWAVRFDLDENDLPQASQLCFESPECIWSIWDSRLLKWPNSLRQKLHTNGFLSAIEEGAVRNRDSKLFTKNCDTLLKEFCAFWRTSLALYK